MSRGTLYILTAYDKTVLSKDWKNLLEKLYFFLLQNMSIIILGNLTYIREEERISFPECLSFCLFVLVR